MKLSNVLTSSLVLLLGVASIMPSAGCAAPTDADPEEAQSAQGDGPTGQDKAKLDDAKNCTEGSSLGEYVCSALHGGTLLSPGDPWIFNAQTLDKHQRAVLTNVGTVAIKAFVEQGLAWSKPVRLEPGQSVNVTPIDDEWWSYGLYSVIFESADDNNNLTPDTGKVRLQIGAFTPEHTACNDECSTTFEGCLQGCGMNEHGNGWCALGCEAAESLCLDHCAGR